jgi:hypothetical protein
MTTEPLYDFLKRRQARAIEQYSIDLHGLEKNDGDLWNKINKHLEKERPRVSTVAQSCQQRAVQARADATGKMSASKRSRLQPGDVLEADLKHGYGYLAYVGTHDRMEDAVWVVPRAFAERVTEPCALFAEPGYIIFYLARRALKLGLVRKVGHCTTAVRPLPTTLRYMLSSQRGGFVTLWNVSDGVTNLQLLELTEEQKKLPVAESWNHQALIARIAEGWTPAVYTERGGK